MQQTQVTRNPQAEIWLHEQINKNQSLFMNHLWRKRIKREICRLSGSLWTVHLALLISLSYPVSHLPPSILYYTGKPRLDSELLCIIILSLPALINDWEILSFSLSIPSALFFTLQMLFIKQKNISMSPFHSSACFFLPLLCPSLTGEFLSALTEGPQPAALQNTIWIIHQTQSYRVTNVLIIQKSHFIRLGLVLNAKHHYKIFIWYLVISRNLLIW